MAFAEAGIQGTKFRSVAADARLNPQTADLATLFGDDVDDAAKGIRAIEGRHRSPDDLDAIDIVKVVGGASHIVAAENIVFCDAVDHQQRPKVLGAIHAA